MEVFKLDQKRMIFILLIVMVVLIALLFDQCNRKNQAITEKELIKNKTDTIIKIHDELGREQTKVFKTMGDYMELMKSLQIKIKDIGNVKQPGSSITYINGFTPINFNSKPFVIHDIVTNESTFYDTIRGFDKWITGTIKMNKDTSIVHLNIESDYLVTLGYDKKHWYSLKRAIPFASVYNLNPYTINRDIKVYRVNMPRTKRFGIGFGVMYGISNDLKTNILIGAGITYNLITF